MNKYEKNLFVNNKPASTKEAPSNWRRKQSEMKVSCQSLVLHASLMAEFEVNITDITRLSLDLGQICFREFDGLFMLRKQGLCSVLTKASLDHLLNLERFDSKKIQNHVVRETELRS
jgi:hypothetical protein